MKAEIEQTAIVKETTNFLDEVYARIMTIVKSDDDYETKELIKKILYHIDEIQNEIENLKIN